MPTRPAPAPADNADTSVHAAETLAMDERRASGATPPSLAQIAQRSSHVTAAPRRAKREPKVPAAERRRRRPYSPMQAVDRQKAPRREGLRLQF
jgi:hypothetical protein